MSSKVTNVDIVIGLAWGDEAKGKISSHLASSGEYNLVARWGGGNNAGHTVFIEGNSYKTHLVPSGVFHGIKSLVGPGCVLHPESFFKELDYLELNGFDTSLVHVHPNCHIVTSEHIEEDKASYHEKLGTTLRGIAPVYASKYARTGILAKDIPHLEPFMWSEELSGNILCEGAQGVWLDIDHGNYPYVTSSSTLPYAACSLGFAPQKIRNIYGAIKAYDTRSGKDPMFPESLLEDPELLNIANSGMEYGVTTGRRRKVQWLNLNLLKKSINITGTTIVVLSKIDILEKTGVYKLISDGQVISFTSLNNWSVFVENTLTKECPLMSQFILSSSPERI